MLINNSQAKLMVIKKVMTMAPTPPSKSRSTRSASNNPPPRIIRVNASDRSTVSALSGAVGATSPPVIERRLDENRLEFLNCDDEADTKDSSNNQNNDEAIEKFISLDQEGGDGGYSDVKGDECVIN